MESMVRVLGTTGSNSFRTVNVAPTGTAFPSGAAEYCTQVGTGHAGPSFETVQQSNYTGGTGPANGLRTIVIPGYNGPI